MNSFSLNPCLGPAGFALTGVTTLGASLVSTEVFSTTTGVVTGCSLFFANFLSSPAVGVAEDLPDGAEAPPGKGDEEPRAASCAAPGADGADAVAALTAFAGAACAETGAGC